MAKKDYNWLGIAAIVAAIGAGAIVFGSKVAKGMERGIGDLGKNIQLPSFSFSMPDIKMPDIKMPDITLPSITVPNIVMPSDNTQIAKAITEGLKNASPLPNSTEQMLIDLINQYRPGYIIPKQPDPGATPLPSDTKTGTLAGWFSGIQKDFTPSQAAPTKSTSQGGNGIFVENGDKDYYVPDNSLYGGNSGMPIPQAAPTKEPDRLLNQKTIVTRTESDFKAVEQAVKAESPLVTGGWYIKDGVWRQRGVDGY